MKKYKINVTKYDGSNWTSRTYDMIVDGESEEDVKERYSGMMLNFDEVVINSIEEIDSTEEGEN